MAKSQRVRLHDMQAIDRLMNKCLELWADPHEWRQHLVEGISRITNVVLCMCEHRCHAGAIPEGVVAGRATCGWPDDRTRRRFFDALDGEPGAEGMPNFGLVVRRLMQKGAATAWRGEVVDDVEWRNSNFFQGVFEPAELDDGMVSLRFDPRPGHFMIVGLNRFRNNPPFDARQQQLLHLIAEELAPLIGTRLALEGQRSMAGLTRRRREALQWLLDGLSEREIARHMHISPTTVHQYIGELYKHFDVRTRGQLMAYFIRRRPRG